MTEHALILEDVSVRKSGNFLLSGINLRIEKNEFVGVIGPN